MKKADILVYFLVAPGLILYHALDRFKLIYFLPLIYLLAIFFSSRFSKNQKIQFDGNMGIGLIIYSLMVIGSILASFWNIEVSPAIRDVLIFASPLVLFFPHVRFNMRHIQVLFISAIVSYIAWVGFSNFDFALSFKIFTSNFNSKSEFHNGIIFGGFFLFFFSKKKWIWALVALWIIFLTGKRAIFLGLIPAFAMYYLFLVPTKLEKSRDFIGVSSFLYFLAFLLVGFYILEVSQWFIDRFDPVGNLTVHKFLMGREKLVFGLKGGMENSSLFANLFGHGPGQADYYLYERIRPDWVRKGQLVNPHNDCVKLIFDYGWVGAVSFFGVLYTFYIKSRMGIQMFLYTVPLFLVDNSLIFIYYLFIAGIIARYEEELN